jgi:protein SCO1/2
LSIKTEKHHSKDYEGKIYVADFSLPLADHLSKMTANLFEVQKIIDKSDAAFPYCVSEVDSVPVLKEYAIKYGVNDKKWNLVTGDKIYTMARKSYLAVKLGKPVSYMIWFILKISYSRCEKRVWLYDGTNKRISKN